MYEHPTISTEQLSACLQQRYGISPATIDFLPLGLDYHAAVYRVVSEQGAVYLLKIKAGKLYEAASLVPYYLHDMGIDDVIAPLPARDGIPWTQLEEWAVLVYPFVEGDTNWNGMTDEQWRSLGTTLRRIHQITLPAVGFESLRKETFDPAAYIHSIGVLDLRQSRMEEKVRGSWDALCSAWREHQPKIHAALNALERLGRALRGRELPLVVCHADLHPANLLRDQQGRVFVIDWDEAMLAPRERDFIFIRSAVDDSEVLPGSQAFFQGYGQTEIDWAVLTYFRYERVVQDLISCAEEVLLRSDVSEEAKMEAAQLFQSVLADGGEIEAAMRASIRVPVHTFEDAAS